MFRMGNLQRSLRFGSVALALTLGGAYVWSQSRPSTGPATGPATSQPIMPSSKSGAVIRSAPTSQPQMMRSSKSGRIIGEEQIVIFAEGEVDWTKVDRAKDNIFAVTQPATSPATLPTTSPTPGH